MSNDAAKKITSSHLKRDAYLYVRQSTLKQVVENTESTQRQYALRERALSLGWPLEKIIVIDNDLGLSGAQASDRHGFQRLVADVGLDRAGIVMGLEVSRLARNSSDWHRLLEICALSDTLILDEDGVYNPADFNDRLLLGLKGTMSEAELHVLRARMLGGLINKAKRGELEIPLPIGFVYDTRKRVQLDADVRVQQTIKTFFTIYKKTGSATATCREFHKQGLLFPRQVHSGIHRGEIVWAKLQHHLALNILHNPRYAGGYVFGRRKCRKKASGGYEHSLVAREDWLVFIPSAHQGYIILEEFEANQKTLKACSQAYGNDRKQSPPREGPALLQGLVICGICGDRMTIRYQHRSKQLAPEYVCQRQGIENCQPTCQWIPGAPIDDVISTVLLEAVSPLALQVALSVQEEIVTRAVEVDSLRKQHVEKARYEAELARRRYMQVDPENRLVACSLEAEWNERLRDLSETQKDYETQTQRDQLMLSEERLKEINALSENFPRLWNDPKTPIREKKRLIRLILDSVTLHKGQEVKIDICFKGGATRSLTLPRAQNAGVMRKTPPHIVQEIDQLLNTHRQADIAKLLNNKGLTSGEGKPFNKAMINHISQSYNLKERRLRQKEDGMLSRKEVSKLLGLPEWRVTKLAKQGFLRKGTTTQSNRELFEPPTTEEINSIRNIKPSKIGRPAKVFT